ncbi:hypothetical protein MBLNU457_7450t1 [Dothideomycetes sp. NU457]
MLSTIQTRYDRLEKALTALLDTIISYNPSIHAADDLVDADDSVNEALDELIQHHANYTRILSLRQTAASLDEQIKSTMRLLSSTRSDLRSISSPSPHEQTHSVRAEDLLSYAKFIAKTSVPPTFRKEITDAIPSTSLADEPQPPPVTTLTNGIATPANGGADGDGEADRPQTNISKLNEETKAMLSPFANLPFVPWPSQEKINAGALGAAQGMLEAGIDPAGVLSAEEQEREEERRRVDEEERRVVEEEERARRRREGMMLVGHGTEGVQSDVFDPDDI